ncbi:MAG TPA: alkaline phosphatase family protein [bacterium]|nr:alkaline phosphatase family protein [bacterium]
MTDMRAIKHLIVLMMENRSFDYYLGALTLEGRTDIHGLTRPLPAVTDLAGNAVSAWQMDAASVPPVLEVPDPPHGWDAAHADWNDGKNDGFVVQYQRNPSTSTADAKTPMGYYTRATLPVLYALADRFTVCDHWFGSVLSSTWPNRKYLHSGKRDGDNDTQTLPPFPGFQTTPLYHVLEDCLEADGSGRTLTWKCYFSDLPFLAFWYRFAASHGSNFAHVGDFVADCREDRLPTISVIDPAFTVADDHPAHNPRLGEKFIGLVVDALTNSESWASSALVILYDENGGFYDHVAPPPCFERPLSPDTPLGFRVPALVVSPYAKKGCCHTTFDHTSIMKSIHVRWNVPFGPEFGTRWQAAPDIWTDCFDFTQPAVQTGTYTGAPITDINWGTGVHDRMVKPPDVLEGLLERIFLLPELKALDRRAQVYDTLGSFEQSVVTTKRMTDMTRGPQP